MHWSFAEILHFIAMKDSFSSLFEMNIASIQCISFDYTYSKPTEFLCIAVMAMVITATTVRCSSIATIATVIVID